MKSYYENRSKTFLARRTPVIIRLDGKAFHTFTRGFNKPFDEAMCNAMQETMKYLCETLYDKEIIVKNKSNELIAKCSLEDYLKRKHGDSFGQLIITRCVPDYFGGANIFNDLFYGRQF